MSSLFGWAVTKSMALVRRRRQGLGHLPPPVPGLQLVGLVAAALVAISIFNGDRGRRQGGRA